MVKSKSHGSSPLFVNDNIIITALIAGFSVKLKLNNTALTAGFKLE